MSFPAITADGPLGTVAALASADSERFRSATLGSGAWGVTAAMTISAWVRPTLFNVAASNQIMNVGRSGGGATGYALSITPDLAGSSPFDDPRWRFAAVSEENDSMVSRTFTVAKLNVWSHVLVTWDGLESGAVVLYVDGVSQELEITGTEDSVGGTNILDLDIIATIGANIGSTAHFTGDVHSIALWDKVLPAIEVVPLYNSGLKAVNLREGFEVYQSQANLKHWFRMGQNAAGSFPAGGPEIVDQVLAGAVDMTAAMNQIEIANDLITDDRSPSGRSIELKGGTDILRHGNLVDIGIANTWASLFWFKLLTGWGGGCLYDFRGTSLVNRFSVEVDTAGTMIFDLLDELGALVIAWRTSGSTITLNAWHSVFITWNGGASPTNFRVSIDGLEHTPANGKILALVQRTGTMRGTPRRIEILRTADGTARVASFALWSSAIANPKTIEEIHTRRLLMDLREAGRDYQAANAATLKQWFVPGLDPTNVGRNYASGGFDLSSESGLSVADQRGDSP